MRMKKFLAVVSALCMMCAVVPVAEHSVSDVALLSAHAYEDITEGMLTFRKYDNHAEVYKCNNLAIKVEIPSEIDGLPVTVVAGFNYCTSLTSVTIPDSVTSIVDGAFFECGGLSSIIIPNSVIEIGESAFSYCENLTSIKIPDNVTSIKKETFLGCTKLSNIEIPASVKDIGVNAFFNTAWLTKKQEENSLVIVNNVLIDGITCEGDVIIPEGVMSINEEAFFNHGSNKSGYFAKVINNIDSIVVPSSVIKIGKFAFDYCDFDILKIKNPRCEISSMVTIDNGRSLFKGTIYGYENSTAQSYAEKYNLKFESLGSAPDTTESKTEEKTNNDIEYMEENKITLDFNKDGIINTKDAAWILVYAAEKGAGNVNSLEEFFQKNQVN